MKTSLKEVLTSEAWIVTKVIKGYGKYRVDARRRHPMADSPSFFSEWGTNQYINQLCRANYGKNVEELKAFNQ